MKTLLRTAIVASTLAFPSLEAQACQGFVLDVQPAGETSYNPSDAGYLEMQMELTLLDGPGDRSCSNNSIEISSRGPTPVLDLQNGGSVLRAEVGIQTPSFATYSNTTLRLSPSLVNQLVRNGRVSFTYARVRPGVFAPAGRYTNILDISVNGQVVTSYEPELVVEPSMRLLGDVSNGQGRADFGILESFDRVTTDFVYQSNTRISVSATSENQGHMIHEDGGATGRIPYTVRVDNSPLSTDGIQTVPMRANIGAQSLGTVQMETGEIGNPVAGQYSDTLTLHFIAE